MIPFGNQNITLLHAENGTFKRYTLSGCSWRSAKAHSMSVNTLVTAAETRCRIPTGQKIPAPGDLLIKGVEPASAENEIALIRLVEKLRNDGKEAFRARQVRNNTGEGVPLPHYAVTGE